MSIGKDSATMGLNSGIVEKVLIYGDFSAIVGVKITVLRVIIRFNWNKFRFGSQGYVTNIGGQGNIVSSNYTVHYISTKPIEGSQHTLFGENNLVRLSVFDGRTMRLMAVM